MLDYLDYAIEVMLCDPAVLIVSVSLFMVDNNCGLKKQIWEWLLTKTGKTTLFGSITFKVSSDTKL